MQKNKTKQNISYISGTVIILMILIILMVAASEQPTLLDKCQSAWASVCWPHEAGTFLLPHPFYRCKSGGKKKLQWSPFFIKCFQNSDPSLNVNHVPSRVTGTELVIDRPSTMSTGSKNERMFSHFFIVMSFYL